MTVAVTAVVGSTVVGMYGAKKGADAAKRSGDQQTALGYEQLDFEKEQADIRRGDYLNERDYQRGMQEEALQDYRGDRARWDEIYGNLEDNLSDFYNNLTPETFAAAGIEHQVKEFEQAKQRVTQTIAQRNIDGSGVGLSLDKQAEFALAENKANIRHDAPLQVAEAKQGFVTSSGGKPGSMPRAPSTGVGPNATGVSNAINNLGSIAGNQAQRGYDLMDSSANLIGTGIGLGIKHWPKNGGGGGGGLPGDTWTMANPSAAAGDVERLS